PKRSNTFSQKRESVKHWEPMTNKLDLAAKTETVNNDGAITGMSTAPPSTPSSVSGAKKLPSRRMSALYGEGKQVLRDFWNEGLAGALEELKDRRDTEKRGSPVTKSRTVMGGALPVGSKKGHRVLKLPGWAKIRRQGRQDGAEGGDLHGFEGGYTGSYTGHSTGATAVSPSVRAGPTGPDKRSAFTEMFRLSREKTRESSKDSEATSKEGRSLRESLLKKTKDYLGSVMH
ncbi:hypothetical protein FN846DRAFT_948938, partial [Sphaerosporella brunnea]